MVKKRQSGGDATPMPAPYLGKIPGMVQPAVQPGQDLAHPYDQTVRRFLPEMRGGFSPSIMEPFARSAAQYITPVALYSGYKLMTRKRAAPRRSRRTRGNPSRRSRTTLNRK